MANSSSQYSESNFYHFSDLDKIVYVVLCGVMSVFAAVGNALYLACYFSDPNLKCCFHMFVANIALCDLTLAFVMTSLNVFVLYRADFVLCIVYRSIIFFVKQESLLLLYLITIDRIQLVKGVMNYRQHVNERRYYRMVLLTWLICLMFNVGYTFQRVLVHLDEDDADFKLNEASRCYAVTFHAIDWFIAIQISLYLIQAVIYAYVLKLCRLSKGISFSLQDLTSKRASEETRCSNDTAGHERLAGRDMAARALSNVSNPVGAVALPSQVTPQENVDQSVSTSVISDAMTTVTSTCERDDKQTATAGESDFDPTKHRRSVTFTKAIGLSAASRLAAEPSVSLATTASARLTPSLIGSSSTTMLGFSKHRRSWAKNSIVQSMLPMMLVRGRSLSYPSETLAAQQLGLLLLVHFICYCPVLMTRFIASLFKDGSSTVSGFVHWLDWLALLRPCLFPIIYLLYSARLRDYCFWYFCMCRCRQKKQVAPSRSSIEAKPERRNKE